MPKTGTSYLQAFLPLNKDRLREAGYLYPWARKVESTDEAKITSGNGAFLARAEFSEDGPADPQVLARLRKAIEVAGGRLDVIVSSEFFAGWDAAKFRWIAGFAEGVGCDLKVIVYLRDQADMAVAHYFQRLKRSPDAEVGAADFERFLKNYVKSPYMDFESFLGMLGEACGGEALVVRPFNRTMFPEGNVGLDFLERIGVGEEARASFESGLRDVNITPRQRDLFFRFHLSRFAPGMTYADALLAGASDLYRNDPRDHSANLFVNPELVRETRARFAEGNRRVADRWFGGMEPAELFRPKEYEAVEEMEVTKDDLFHWLLWTNSALIQSMKAQERLERELRVLQQRLNG